MLEPHLFGLDPLVDLFRGEEVLEFLQAVHLRGNGAEVGEHPAQPALVDVGHPGPVGLLLHDLLGLLLGTYVEDGAAAHSQVLHVLEGTLDLHHGLLQINDEDAVALGVDVALHLGVPAAGLVSKVHTSVEQLANGYDGHGRSPCPAHMRKLRLLSQ